jgi:hypothetical protein
MSRLPLRSFAALAAVAVLGCESSTSPGGDAQLTRVCANLTISPSDMASCSIRVTPLNGGTLTINSVTLIGHGGQPVGAGFAYGNALGLRFYSSPTPPTLAGQSVGPSPFEFLITAVISTGDGETTPAPGSYPAAVRVNVTPAGGAATDLEVAVTIVVTA